MISKYRNLEFRLGNNEDYIIIETICINNIYYGYMVNKNDYLKSMIVEIREDNNIIGIRDIHNDKMNKEFLAKFMNKLQ